MFTTTLAAIALAGGISSGAIPSAPNWHTDYAQAMSRSSAEGKPMAVFIGNGADRLARMTADGTITGESARVLRASYICVYLDSETAAGKDLASRFEMTEGLVISSRGGNVQAYRHSGSIGGKELTDSLSRFAGGDQPVITSTNGASGSYSSNGSVIVGRAANTGVVYPSQYYAPAPTQYIYPSSGYSYPQFNSYPALNCTGFK
jgi:hypothetical protein